MVGAKEVTVMAPSTKIVASVLETNVTKDPEGPVGNPEGQTE